VSFEKIAENKVREAMANGEFDNLPDRGKVDLDAYFALPEDLRMAYTLLKNANCVPEDVAILNEIARLREAVERADPLERDLLSAALRDQEMRLNLLRESRKRPSGGTPRNRPHSS
jgi:hypothetical protein